nr:hypothetical protein [Methanoregulaceae archaeon]
GSMAKPQTVLYVEYEIPASARTTPGISVSENLDPGTAREKLAGTNFVSGAQVQLRKSGAPTIEATNEVVVSSLKITGKIPIPSTATKGVYDVVVINPDGKSGIKPSAFRIL